MALDDDPTSNQPLAGVVLCCTAILADVRTQIADTAQQMGASLRLDLTSDVTHLLVGKIDTPKYRYVAKERPDIRVVRAEWVEAVRAAWMAGDDVDAVDADALARAHALPPFFGLKLCVTKFDTLEAQAYYADATARNGAVFSGDLTKDVTHLVAAVPEGAKYTHARAWGIPVVSAKWFEDSLTRGMALDEALYALEVPVERQGEGAFRVEKKPARTSLGKRGREGEELGGDVGKRKLRRVASTRLEGQSQDLWQGMSEHEVQADKRSSDAWKDEQPEEDASTHATAKDRPRNGTAGPPESKTATTDESQGLFAGQYILIQGFEPKRANRIRDYLEPNGACVVRTVDELEEASSNLGFQGRVLLTPHATPDDELRLPDVPPGTSRATEWWIERCIHYKRLVEPAKDVLSQPLGNAAVPGIDGLLVSTTGFAGVDLRQAAEAVKLMGAEYQETLLPSTQILVSASQNVKKEKAFYASKHKIPIVGADWLWDCLKARTKAPIEKHRIILPVTNPTDVLHASSTTSPAPTGQLPHKSAGDGQRADDRPKRLSSSRKRHATPSLMLQPSATDGSTRGPFVHEDEDDAAELPPEPTAMGNLQGMSQPLCEISPNASPRKKDEESFSIGREKSEESRAGVKRLTGLGQNSMIPPPLGAEERREEEQVTETRASGHLSEQINSLMERRRASRPETGDTASPQKRKSRPLGRNLSGIGNRSASASARSDSMARTLPADLRESNSPADGFSFAPHASGETPSTQLGYESLSTEAHRQQMSKKMGTDLHDDSAGTRVASLGTVKDSELITRKGMRDRAKGRQRQQMKS